MKEAKYLPLAFSDHFAHVVQFILPGQLSKILSPKSQSSFKVRAEVLKDSVFKYRLDESMKCWQRVRQFQNENSRELGTLYWWEKLVKPGINKIALQRSKEINKARREELNLLLLRQLYLTRKLVLFGHGDQLGELQAVHLLIDRWYNKESEKIQHQSRVNEFQENEKSSIYHHELHKKIVKKSSILKLQTESGLILGHTACATYLEQTVEDLLLHPGDLDLLSQQILL